MKKLAVPILILVMAASATLFYYRIPVGNFLWQKYHWAGPAIFFNRDAKFAMTIGNYYFNGGAYDLDKAKQALGEAVKIDPGILWGHYQLARIHFIQKDYSRALGQINKELEFNPENLRSLYVRGLINGYSDNLLAAENDFQRFINWAPKEWAGYNDLVWVLGKLEKYQEAKLVLARAFQEVPKAGKNPWLWNGSGVILLNLKEYQAAQQTLNEAKYWADQLTINDWQKAYPGNHPATAVEGIAAFKKAIEENLKRAQIIRE